MAMKTYTKRIGLTAIAIFLLMSCSSKCIVHLPTDNPDPENASDAELIILKIAFKAELYKMEKILYKSSARKKAFNEISELSAQANKLYMERKITAEKYNKVQKEAKHVVQQAIYRMKAENGNPGSDDLILDYLNTGIEALKRLIS
jgi:hypothetical protein